MSSNVLTLGPDRTLVEAADAMIAARVGSAVVLEGGKVIGIVTERDVMRMVASGTDPRRAEIAECMTSDPISVLPATNIHAATSLMFERGFRHLPVEEDGKLVGIVSSRDLLRAAEQEAARHSAVLARNAERRRIERDIHDGAQQRLVAIRMKLQAALKAMDGIDEAGVMLTELQADLDDALDALRDLAMGNYESRLEELGVLSALRAEAARSAFPVEIDGRLSSRCDPDVEAAVYFCCLEALQNVAKHAKATRARIFLEDRNGQLFFSVSDDGVGFDPGETLRGSGYRNMQERLNAVGGTLEVVSARRTGTTVIGRVPIDHGPSSTGSDARER